MQRGAAASAAPGLEAPSSGAACFEKPGRGHDGAAGASRPQGPQGPQGQQGQQEPPGPQGPVCRSRRPAWSLLLLLRKELQTVFLLIEMLARWQDAD